ncbi:MAG: hypothetical protein IJ235_05730 [Eubacterium sp.]|nr:hypothetical protein [Eubacterium sp.]
MKVLKRLNRINTLMLFAYIPFMLIDFDNFFYGKENEDNITGLALILFFTTFICGGAILVTALKRNVNNEFSIIEALKATGKTRLAALLLNFAVSTMLVTVFVKSDIVWFYIVCSLISTVFVIGESVVIAKIDVSPYYRITLPWYVFPIPFVYFFASNVWVSYHIDDSHSDAAVIFNFILSGIMLMYCAWHFTYIIDEKAKTIEKEYGVLSFFVPNKVIYFYRITSVTKKGIYYTVSDGITAIKISRYLGGAKRLEQSLINNGIYIEDS